MSGRLALKRAKDLSLEEIQRIQEYIKHDWQVCDCCGEFAPALHEIPAHLAPYINGVNPFWKPLDRIVHEVVELENADRACESCISTMTSLHRTREQELCDEQKGIIRYGRWEIDTPGFARRKRARSGYVYVVFLEDGVFKIGATSISVPSRLHAQGLDSKQWFALKTRYPFLLEQYLHSRYKSSRVEIVLAEGPSIECFRLSSDEVEFLTNIQSFNDCPVTLLISPPEVE